MNNEKLLQEMLEAEVSMQDLITDIYAVNLALYMDNHNLDMPEEFKQIGKKFLIDRNMAFMSQHMDEVWCSYQNTVSQVREQIGEEREAGRACDEQAAASLLKVVG